MKALLIALIFISTYAYGQKVTSTDPEVNFEKFWTAYESAYPFFGDKGIDWKDQYKKYRPLVNNNTPDDSLFQILAQMVAPLHDAHVEVHTHGAKEEKKFWARRPAVFSGEFQFSKDSLYQFWEAVDSTLSGAGFGPVQAIGGTFTDSLRQFYYAKTKDLGYLRMIECTFGNGSSGKKLAELDSIFTYFGPVKALIFDIRFNRGGGEALALRVAGRFIAKTPGGARAYRYRRKKNGSYSDFVKLPSFRNKPRASNKTRYLGPVYLLTNNRTVSAGDLLALYLSQISGVTIIGTHTEGSFDSFRYQYLPNGWHFSVPRKRYVRVSDTTCYEGIGVPPDIVIENSRSALEHKTDSVLLRTLEEINLRSAF
jgi:carboxyl-terminal processing protease